MSSSEASDKEKPTAVKRTVIPSIGVWEPFARESEETVFDEVYCEKYRGRPMGER